MEGLPKFTCYLLGGLVLLPGTLEFLQSSCSPQVLTRILAKFYTEFLDGILTSKNPSLDSKDTVPIIYSILVSLDLRRSRCSTIVELQHLSIYIGADLVHFLGKFFV